MRLRKIFNNEDFLICSSSN